MMNNENEEEINLKKKRTLSNSNKLTMVRVAIHGTLLNQKFEVIFIC